MTNHSSSARWSLSWVWSPPSTPISRGASRPTSSRRSSFASLSQVGLIVAEIGLGFRYVALVHILGHACLRTLQFVRAPTLLHDYHTLENAIGEHLPRSGGPWDGLAKNGSHAWLYRFALERGYLDTLLMDWVVVPYVRLFRWFDSLERRWTDFLTGDASRESDQVNPPFGTIEELS